MKNKEKVKNKDKITYEHSKPVMTSYGAREMFGQFITAAFGFNVLFFYESVIGLGSLYILIGFTIYSLWNGINDPLIGYLMERIKMPWEKKKGYRRFPWIIIAAIPWAFSYFLIFLVPAEWDPTVDASYNLPVFLWYMISIIIYDTLLTIYDVNALSLYPVKFRGLDERRTVQGFGTILGILGLVLAVIIPSIFIDQAVASTYAIAALVSTIFGLMFFILILPGVWETKRIKEENIQRIQDAEKAEVDTFSKEMFKAVKERRFMMKVLFFYGYQVAAVMIQQSARYIIAFVLRETGDAADLSFILLLGFMLLGALISVPLWTFFSKKVNNNKKMSIAAGIFMFLTFLPMIFIDVIWGWIITLLFFGIGLGGQWFMDPPTMGDVLDDIAVRTGKRQQSIYYGFQALFIRLGYATIVIVITLVHILTGFVEGAPTYAELVRLSPTPELAIFGIRIHSAIFPAIIVIITVLLFWKFYDLTPEKVAENKKKLEEMNL
ncbi:MAG: putative Major facilitator superfamily MFS_1 [Promethearchaeota archaeon]|nr:MAG: putative Major facilitator superfamily MFS_1 [Candidatus Lokiarchaeota archaeon]